MKRTLLLLMAVLLSASIFGQGQIPCSGPIPVVKFNQRLDGLRSVKNENQRLAKLKETSVEFCLTTEQVKAFAELLVKDFNKLDFIEFAYKNIPDKENFYEVYDVLSKMSNVMRLHDYVQGFTPIITPPPPPPMQACHVGHEEFNQIVESVKKESFSQTKTTLVKQVLVSKHCFRTDQIKEIVKLFDFEENKLEIAKFAYDYCTNKQDYYQLNDVFSFSASKEELVNYIQGKH